MSEEGLLIVISGPSGVGKGTIVRRLREADPSITVSVSCTTRPPREGEEEGVSYFFVTRERFLGMLEEGGLLEHSEHFGNLYGTPRAFVEESLGKGDVILEIEPDGAMQAKAAYPGAFLVMIVPPDTETLVARMRGRGNEKTFDEAERLRRAEYEMSKADLYDAVIVNDDLDEAVREVREAIRKRKADTRLGKGETR